MDATRIRMLLFALLCVISLADSQKRRKVEKSKARKKTVSEAYCRDGELYSTESFASFDEEPLDSAELESPKSEKDRPPPSHIMVLKGFKRLRIDCPLKVGGNVDVSWKKDGLAFETEGPAKEDSRVRSIKESRKGSFYIRNVTEEDQALYECTAAFGHGPKHANVTLIVKGSDVCLLPEGERKAFLEYPQRARKGSVPSFKRPGSMLTTVREMLGGRIELKCKASGPPEVTYRWLKDGKDYFSRTISQERKSENFHRPRDTSPHFADHRVVISEITRDDAGNYTCIATNIFGSISYNFEVQVNDCIDIKPQIVKIDATLNKVMPGGNTTLSCLVKSCVPSHTVTGWHKAAIDDPNFEKKIDMLGCSRYESGDNWYRCIFDIANFNASHVGTYMCYTSIQGRDGSQLKDNEVITLAFDARLSLPDESSMERPKKGLIYVLGGTAAVVAIVLLLLCLCICRGCCCMSEKEDALATKTSSSTFRRPVAPDYVITGQQEGVGHYDYAVCARSASQPFSGPPSPKSFTSLSNNHNFVHESLLKSPDMRGKGEGSATEYEDVAEDLSVYCTQHPPSVVSSYAAGYYDPSARYVPYPTRLSTIN
ncbi:hypothetical protein RvY_09855 [Ramazzottius varieornatus]|uniref:Ig-like domain-containing protein n=1 Tax=Ramazzottius varieornatus TaxID=947166 RepID=A0A1D1VG58_RAMVA|nr:hypothetical protein RvY_09855 [Ramazzottius varieornatus]